MQITVNSLQEDIKEGVSRMRTAPSSVKDILQKMLDGIGTVDFHELTGTPDSEKIGRKEYIISIIDELLRVAASHRWDLTTRNSLIYMYDGAKWVAVREDQFKSFLRNVAIRMGAPAKDSKYFRFQDDLFKQFFAASDIPAQELPPSTVLINMKNGTFEFTPQGRRIRGHRKEDFLTYQLPFGYDENADCPKFKAFMDRNLPDKGCQDVIAEYLGYVFAPFLRFEKVLLLYGDGANGKSVLFQIVSALLGPENISSYSLQSLTSKEGYQRAEIGNKLLNYATEINGKIDSSLFKQLASSEPIEARYIYGRAFILDRYARLMFNCNVLPSEVELTHAFFRRFIIVPFEVIIPESEQDRDLAGKIIADELPGIFNWILKGLDRLLANKSFSTSEKIANAGKAFREQSDSFSIFMSDSGLEPGMDRSMLMSTFYQEYSRFCRGCNLLPVSMKDFSDKLLRLGFQKQHKRNGNLVYYKTISDTYEQP